MRSSLVVATFAFIVSVGAPYGCRKFYRDPSPPPPPAAADAGAADVASPFVQPPELDAGPDALDSGTPTAETPSSDGIFRVNETTRGTVPAALVKQRIDAALPAITACYDRALAHHAGLRGNLRVQFVVASDGSVGNATSIAVSDRLENPAAVSCVLSEFKKLTFPKPNGDRAVLTFPLHFEPPPADAGSAAKPSPAGAGSGAAKPSPAGASSGATKPSAANAGSSAAK